VTPFYEQVVPVMGYPMEQKRSINSVVILMLATSVHPPE